MGGFLPNEHSRASLLLDYLRAEMLNAGDCISYIDVLELLGVEADPREASSLLSEVISTVNKRLYNDGDWRHLATVETVGYRIATPADLRHETFARLRRSERQQVATQRAIVKVIRHPDSTAAEQRRASDAAAAQAPLLMIQRREQRKIRRMWPAEETSPVPDPPVA